MISDRCYKLFCILHFFFTLWCLVWCYWFYELL